MPRHTSPRFWIALAASALGVLALDQATKAWVLAHADILTAARPTVGLTLVWNEAVAFSLPLRGAWVYLVATAVLLIVVPSIARALDRTKAAGGMLLGLLLGGAAGNLIDRIRFDAVVDFVKVGWWPVFNIADAAISTSIVALLLFGKYVFTDSRSRRSDVGRVRELGFNEKIVPLVVSGERTVTIRTNPVYAALRAGDVLRAVHTQAGKVFGTITLTSVDRTTLGKIRLPMQGYGHQTIKELRAELDGYYSTPVTDDTTLFVIRFKLTSIDAHTLAELEARPLQH